MTKTRFARLTIRVLILAVAMVFAGLAVAMTMHLLVTLWSDM